MNSCLAPSSHADAAQHADPDCGAGDATAPAIAPNPFLMLADGALARACTARAAALESLGWATEAERVALRTGTALLLEAVSRRLSDHPPVDGAATTADPHFRLEHLICESLHAPFLAAYQRRHQQDPDHEPFGSTQR